MRKYSEPGDPYTLLGDLEQSRQLQDEQKIQRFSCACCRLIWAKLPPIAQEALTLGEKAQRRDSTAETVFQFGLRCDGELVVTPLRTGIIVSKVSIAFAISSTFSHSHP